MCENKSSLLEQTEQAVRSVGGEKPESTSKFHCAFNKLSFFV